MKKRFLNWLAIPLVIFSLAACSDDDKNARVQVWLTDAPGDYEEVNVEVIGVEIHTGDDANDEGGWKALNVNNGIYNLRELTNGLDTLLGTIEIPAGTISQIRLKLGDDNSIKVDGSVHPLDIPSGSQSGLKLQVHEELTEGITYKILLDFDVARSIVHTGSNEWKLKPVIRTITEAQDGAVKGLVDPKEATPAIYAIMAGDTIGTTYADSTGHFLIRGLGAGSYEITFEPNSGYKPTSQSGVAVTIGNVTDLGTVTIESN
jgi:hypothetical protein